MRIIQALLPDHVDMFEHPSAWKTDPVCTHMIRRRGHIIKREATRSEREAT